MRTFIVLLTIFASSILASAQEIQVPFDHAGKVFLITRSFNEQYKIITGFDDFVEARLFMRADSTYSLEAVTESFGLRARSTRPLTEAEVNSIRDRVDAVLLTLGDEDVEQDEQAPRVDRNQDGRTALLWGSTLWSLLYYGTATSVALDIEEPAIPILLAGGLGYLVPALLTNDASVTEGAASLALGGMFQGTLHGWALAMLLSGDQLTDSDQPRLGFGLSVLTGIAETVAGYVVATNTNMREGRASVINTTAFYGLACGALTTVAIFDQIEPSSDVAVRVGGGAALLGAAAGVVAGNAVADGQHYSSGDASMYGITGFLGAALPWVVIGTIQPDDLSATLASSISIATTIGGLWLGDQLVRGKDYRGTDGTISVLSLIGGGLIGLGTAIAIDDSDLSPALVYAGALGGFGISLAMAKPKRETKSTSGIEINVNPMGPLMLQRDAYGITRPAPFVTARYRF